MTLSETEETLNRRLALISHDMRAALADVVGGLQLVEDSMLDAQSQLQLERVRAAGETLERLLSEAAAAFGDVADQRCAPGLGNTGGPAECGPPLIALTDLLRDLERRWVGHAAGAGLVMQTDVARDVPLFVAVDPAMLERILCNLVDNALKYAERGTIVLSVATDGEGDLAFRVRDEGPGFSDASLARLFDYGGRPAGSAQPGTGMGLHIAKDLADRLGGRLSVDNLAGTAQGVSTGAEVAFILPAARWRPAEGQLPRLPDLSGKRVLVADDSATNRMVLCRMLDRLGAECTSVGDGIAALDALIAGGLDLALIDIQMPGLSGIEVITAVRGLHDDRAEVPILAVTSYVLRVQRDRIYAAGANGIVTKPVISPTAYAEAIAGVMLCPGRKSVQAPSDRGDNGPERAARYLPGPDKAGRMDASRLPHLLDIAGPEGGSELLDRLDDDLSGAAAGLTQGIQRSDLAAIRAESHVLISLTGALGAEGLQAAMEEMNAFAHAGDLPRIEAALRAVSAPLDRLVAEIAAARASSHPHVLAPPNQEIHKA